MVPVELMAKLVRGAMVLEKHTIIISMISSDNFLRGEYCTPLVLYQLRMSLYCLLYPLRLNADISLRYSGGAVL